MAGTDIDLVKMRNPHGQGEITNGEFDDDGPGWTRYPQVVVIGGSGGGAQQKLTKEQQETLLGKLASFGYDIDEVKQGKQRLATA